MVPDGIAHLVECWALGPGVLGSNLPLEVLEVTKGGHSSGSLTISRCKIGTMPWPGNSELTLRIYYLQAAERAGDGASTLDLKPMGRVIQSPKQRVSVISTCYHKN